MRRSTSFSAKRDAVTAQRFLTKALGGENHPAPRVINTDKHAAYPRAIAELKAGGVLDENSKHRPVQYLNNILEQDHRAIKRRVRASQHFRSFWGAWRTIAVPMYRLDPPATVHSVHEGSRFLRRFG